MARLNKRTRDKLFPILAARDGEFCAACDKVGSTQSLVVDHIDNNPNNNSLDNLQLLCRSCNTKKNPRGKAKPLNDSAEISSLPTTETIRLNWKYEQQFREWLEAQVRRYERVELDDAIASGAEVTGASTATIERYLKKLCSSAGRFRVSAIDGRKFVEFKEWWS
jgi:hypothetical protein